MYLFFYEKNEDKDWSPPYISKKKIELQKMSSKDKWPLRVDLLWNIIDECKKVKMSVTVSKKSQFFTVFREIDQQWFFWYWDFNFNFFCIFSNMHQGISTLPVILSFMKFFVTRTFFYLYKGVTNLHKCW